MSDKTMKSQWNIPGLKSGYLTLVGQVKSGYIHLNQKPESSPRGLALRGYSSWQGSFSDTIRYLN